MVLMIGTDLAFASILNDDSFFDNEMRIQFYKKRPTLARIVVLHMSRLSVL